jgi:hypothetical protein
MQNKKIENVQVVNILTMGNAPLQKRAMSVCGKANMSNGQSKIMGIG